MSIIYFVSRYNMQKSYQETIPELISLEKKNNHLSRLRRNNQEQKYRFKPEQNTINPTGVQFQNNRDLSPRPQAANKVAKAPDDDKIRTQKKANQISKNLINEIMNKLSLKTMFEDNNPINNETVQKWLFDLEQQIKALNIELNKFTNSLVLNPGNQHLKKEKEEVEKKLNQMKTIKQLYIQKIEARNKITQLQWKINELKKQNKQLKIKIARGIEKIESHIHNLPCQRQKQLIEEVNKYKQALDREKEMRQNLELNIQSISLNFKRFYQEADEARKMVNLQLKEINKRQLELKTKEQKMKYHRCQVKTDNRSSEGDNLMGASQVYGRKLTNRVSDKQNLAQIINQINLNELEQGLKRNRSNFINTPATGLDKMKNNKGSNSIKSINLHEGDTKSKFNLEEQIQKMRMNQTQFNRLSKKKYL